ncbi:MAG: tRNA (N(6)-L-threonylcarbamoyladenosine(37)-C(2))-methylthiotransferase MtaB [Desulfobacterota bacterium]|nr:tRNA (N(6)-L-threonylcarbamoyladenosine(37)-C(2))-methylthiotransferase MtaB [Thermodesulfobacteriota bacterium]
MQRDFNQHHRFYIITLGCKANQYESAAIGLHLERQGYMPASSAREATICIVNTCAVTQTSEAQSRQLIRRMLRENRHGTVIVTGCYAQAAPDDIANLSEHIHVLGNVEKDEIAAWIARIDDSNVQIIRQVSDISRQSVFATPACSVFRARTRALLKIQDGCNSRCSYCIVPSVRGPSRSLPPEEVARRIEDLISAGYWEIILTGIHLGSYGLDLSPRFTLGELLRYIVPLCTSPPVRIRLSSVEPNELTDELMEVIAGNTHVICPHLHIPLQSGDDDMLRAMRRPYTAEGFEKIIERVAHEISDVNIGLDVIVGFPGETNRRFENTQALIRRHNIGYLHVFPFSRRQGTPAANFSDQIPAPVKKQRVQILRTLGAQKKQAFMTTQLGKEQFALIERSRQSHPGIFFGTTRNYIPVRVASTASCIGREVKVKITKVCNGVAEATIV